MLAWIKRRFAGRMERNIFAFHDGVRKRYADPLVIQRDLDAAGGEGWMSLLGQITLAGVEMDLNENLRKAAIESSYSAAKQVAEIVRKGFQVNALDDSKGKPIGLTDAECLELLGDFMTWMNKAEADARPLPSSPQS